MALANSELPNTTPARNDDAFADALEVQAYDERQQAASAARVVNLDDYRDTEPLPVQNSPASTEKTARITPAKIVGVGLAGVIAVGGTAYAAGQGYQRDAAAHAAETLQAQADQKKAEYTNSIAQAIDAQYDAKDSIGSVSVGQGGSLGEAGLEVVHKAVGDTEYNAIHDRIYSPLMDSVTQRATSGQTVQPGEQFEVVKTDINPEAHNGDEYIVVPENQVVHTNINGIPTPETH